MPANKNYWVWPTLLGHAIFFALGFNFGFDKATGEDPSNRPVVISPICKESVTASAPWYEWHIPDAGPLYDPCAWPEPDQCRCNHGQ